jgi:tetratricopeptide (TPR) repeat protein
MLRLTAPPRTLSCLALGIVLWGGSLLALQQRDLARVESKTRYVAPPLSVMSAIATDFENLLADSYWLLFLQMNGENLTIEAAAARDYRQAKPTLDLITGLDPHFHEAALFGSWVLADGDRLDEALDLIAAGMARHPEDYRYPYQMGVLEFLYGKRYLEAAHHFEAAAKLPGAPPGTRRFAASMYARGSKQELAIATWRAIHQGATDAQSRAIAERALAKLGARP